MSLMPKFDLLERITGYFQPYIPNIHYTLFHRIILSYIWILFQDCAVQMIFMLFITYIYTVTVFSEMYC